MSLAGVADWPIVAWVVLLALVAFLGQAARLAWRQRTSRAAARVAEDRLTRVAAALRAYADAHGQRLPGTLDDLKLGAVAGVTYRPVPALDLDPKLILVHDGAATHQVVEFPALRPARGMVFCSGALRIMTEEAWEKVEAADNLLREKLGLEPVER